MLARPAKILIQASTESEWVARCLEDLRHEVVVADPNFVATYATRRRFTEGQITRLGRPLQSYTAKNRAPGAKALASPTNASLDSSRRPAPSQSSASRERDSMNRVLVRANEMTRSKISAPPRPPERPARADAVGSFSSGNRRSEPGVFTHRERRRPQQRHVRALDPSRVGAREVRRSDRLGTLPCGFTE